MTLLRANRLWHTASCIGFLNPVMGKPIGIDQEQCKRGHKIYSLHADEVECIGKGKARRPYEFGLEV